MNAQELVTFDVQGGDLSALYTISESGPRLAELKLNRETTVEHNEKDWTVPAPGVKIENADFGVAYGTEVKIRIYLDTMQTSVFDSDQNKYSNMSQHFKSFDQSALDWQGGDKCGWIPSKEREKLRASDPIVFASLSKVKLGRNLFGTVTISDAVLPDGTPVEVIDLPVRMRLGPSNFYEISQIMGKMVRQQCMPIHYDIKLSYVIVKRGSNRFVVLKYEPDLVKMHPLTDEGKDTLQSFLDLIKIENEKVVEKMRENMVTTMHDDFEDITEVA